MDYNIQNYTIHELVDLFELPSNYDSTMVDQRATTMSHNIMNDVSIRSDIKQMVLQFVQSAKALLSKQTVNNSNNMVNKIRDMIQTYENIYHVDTSLQSSDTVQAGSTNIIQPKPTPYGQSMPSEFYPGAINPLAKRILRQNLNIDTRFRDHYESTTSSNFSVVLPMKFNQVVSMQLSALELPSSIYPISAQLGNNYMALCVPDENPFVIVVPDGEYTVTSFQDLVNDILMHYDPDSDYSKLRFLSNTGSEPTLNNSTMVKTVITSVDGQVPFSIDFLTDRYGNPDRQTPLPLKLGWLLGFRQGLYLDQLTYMSEGLVNLLGPQYVYLVVDDFHNNVNNGFYGAFTTSILNKNILARISLKRDSQGMIESYVNDGLQLITSPRQYFGPVDIQKLHIQVLDEYGRVVNFNHMDMSFCLTLQTIYDL